MDLHVATEKVASLKDAALRYAVIVAGILTALALSECTESRKNAQRGAQALADIDAELRRNESMLGKALDAQAKQLAQLQAAEERLGKDSFAVPDIDQRARRLIADATALEVGSINLLALQSSTWDATVASQSLQHLPRERLVPLARAYAATQTVSAAVSQLALSPSTFANVVAIDMYDRGESSDAIRFARALREYRLVLDGVHAGYRGLRVAVRQALALPPVEAAVQPASAAASNASASSAPSAN